jgi:hypothetical protein
MLSLFSIPKSFAGDIGRLQRNAIGSWRALAPNAEIILLGDDSGVAAFAPTVGAVQIAEVARTAWGTPRVDDIFARAERAARCDLLCYVNADIILTRSFFNAVQRMADCRRPFLLVSQRWDLDFNGLINFGDPAWEENLQAEVDARGQLHPLSGIDFFLYRKGFWNAIPPFGVGRTMWDNWLIYHARASGAMLVDATPGVRIVHQNHEYGHHAGGKQGVWGGAEAEHNLALAGGLDHYFTIEDATHTLAARRLRPILRADRVRRWWRTLPVLNPWAMRAANSWAALQKIFYDVRIRVAKWRGRIPR